MYARRGGKAKKSRTPFSAPNTAHVVYLGRSGQHLVYRPLLLGAFFSSFFSWQHMQALDFCSSSFYNSFSPLRRVHSQSIQVKVCEYVPILANSSRRYSVVDFAPLAPRIISSPKQLLMIDFPCSGTKVAQCAAAQLDPIHLNLWALPLPLRPKFDQSTQANTSVGLPHGHNEGVVITEEQATRPSKRSTTQ